MEAPRILVVEDNPDDVAFLKVAFEKTRKRPQLQVLHDGDGILDRLKKTNGRPPDLILLDLNLPSRNGVEVLAELKSDPRFGPIPVIVLTTSRSDREMRTCYRTHANAFVPKPHDFRAYETLARSIEAFWLEWTALPSAAAG